MGVGRGMGVLLPHVKVGARAKIVIFLAREGMYTRWALLLFERLRRSMTC